jgi:translation initiation factor 4E
LEIVIVSKICCQVEHFWRIYDHLKRPSQFKVTTEYHLFKEGITPTWEDPQNKLGGKWMIRLKKGIASRYWEDVVLAIIGEQFDVGPEICGAVISVRNNEDIISIWNKTADNTEAVNKIRWDTFPIEFLYFSS